MCKVHSEQWTLNVYSSTFSLPHHSLFRWQIIIFEMLQGRWVSVLYASRKSNFRILQKNKYYNLKCFLAISPVKRGWLCELWRCPPARDLSNTISLKTNKYTMELLIQVTFSPPPKLPAILTTTRRPKAMCRTQPRAWEDNQIWTTLFLFFLCFRFHLLLVWEKSRTDNKHLPKIGHLKENILQISRWTW